MSITALQILVQILITFFLIGFQSGFAMFWANCYALAMSSTALAVLLGTLFVAPVVMFSFFFRSSPFVRCVFLQVVPWKIPNLDKRCSLSSLSRKCSLLDSLWLLILSQCGCDGLDICVPLRIPCALDWWKSSEIDLTVLWRMAKVLV